MWNERCKFYDRGRELEGDILYINAIIEVYGKKAIINWDTGEVKECE